MGEVYDSDLITPLCLRPNLIFFLVFYSMFTSSCGILRRPTHQHTTRSGRERGLHERAARAGASLPVPIHWINVPMKINPESDSFHFVKWSMLLPQDFVFWLKGNFSYKRDRPKTKQSATNCGSMFSQAATLVKEGYLAALVGDLGELPGYWRGMLQDYPDHIVRESDPNLRASIGCTLYGALQFFQGYCMMTFLIPRHRKSNLMGAVCLLCFLLTTRKGDEVDCLGDSWMFLLWSSDTSKCQTHSPSSRWPICILPASLYVYSESGVNLTLEAATQAITRSFNAFSTEGIAIQELQSLGGEIVPLIGGVINFGGGFPKLPMLVFQEFDHGTKKAFLRLDAYDCIAWDFVVTGKLLLPYSTWSEITTGIRPKVGVMFKICQKNNALMLDFFVSKKPCRSAGFAKRAKAWKMTFICA